MHLYSILVYDFDYSLLYKNFNLTEYYFFVRHKIEQAILEIADALVKSTHEKKLYQITEKVEEKTFYIYVYVSDKYYICLTDQDYPNLVAMELLSELKENMNDKYNEIWNKYQDPMSISKVLQVKKQLEQTKIVMLDSIDKILERGENIEALVEKTNQLEDISIKFRRDAEKLNSCCLIL